MFFTVAIKNLTISFKNIILSLLKYLVTIRRKSMGEDENKVGFGYYEDLIADLDLKLIELLSHVKLLANATGFARDFEIMPEDINALASTIHDKTLAAIITEQKLKLSLENIEI
jgi:hypothetical protein